MTIQNYFQSYEAYFWEWEANSDGLYLAIPNAKTIAHSKLVQEILDHLSEESIPPFGSLLLALIATNSEVEDSFDSILYYVRQKEVSIDGKPTPNLNAAIAFLEKLKTLSGYKKGNKRLLLFKTIFSECHKRISSEKAKLILEDFDETGVDVVKAPFNQANFTNDFKVFELLNKKFPTTNSIIDAMQGIPTDEVMEELNEDVLDQSSVSEQPKDFIEQLIAEDKTFHVGRLIKQIWSGLNIPLHHNMPSSQPLGGISDLTNKGDFDKLLLSEFAQDDDVFMSRLANNEALFIQREVPPEADKFERIILIDATLKNWGNTKLLNFGTALAIAKHPKTDIKCKLFVLGTTFLEVSYASVNEVIDGLTILNPTLDCSPGLIDFITSNKEVSSIQELFVITSEDNLRLDSFSKTIRENSDKLMYVITTNSDGIIHIYKIQNKDKKLVQKIILPLEQLWKQEQVMKKTKVNELKTTEPIYNYPILYALPQNPIATFYLNEKYYILASNKSLHETYITSDNHQEYIEYSSYKGAVILFENISIKSGGVYLLDKNRLDQFELFYYFEKEEKLCYLNLETKDFASIDFTNSSSNKIEKFYEINGKYYLSDNKKENFWEVTNENTLAVEKIIENDLKHHTNRIERKISLFHGHGNNVLKSFNKLFIDRENNIILNIHKLTINNERIVWFPDRSYNPKVTAVRKANKFIFPDESEIIFDKKGMLTFISSNKSIPEFYIPTSLEFPLGIASETEFTGNNYFYDEEKSLPTISIHNFNKEYYIPFINQILNHEV